jgi:hypothetical protein
MKSLREIFRLTNAEQRVVVIIVLALLAAAVLQKRHEQTGRILPEQSAQRATTPNASDSD